MNPIHWIVALITSFSGFFFFRVDTNENSLLSLTADTLIIFAVFLGIVTALVLGRSYDFLPALRHVKTKFVYRFVRHPMYLSSIIIKLGYVLKNPSIYNILLSAVIIILYDKRAKYEEEVMSHNNSYIEYLRQVKYRFIPMVY
jgi:protein-S-isoprenylcysteine O-methyltransferase Ste14